MNEIYFLFKKYDLKARDSFFSFLLVKNFHFRDFRWKFVFNVSCKFLRILAPLDAKPPHKR